MAINRNSEEGEGVGSSSISFLDRFQMGFSASSALAKRGFSLKLHGGGRMKKSRFERFKIIAAVDCSGRNYSTIPKTINNNNTCYYGLS